MTFGSGQPSRPAVPSSRRNGEIMGKYRDVVTELTEPTKSLRTASPDVWNGFGQMHQAAVADGALPAKVKELMALAIAVVKQCDGCIAYHAKAAAMRGATDRRSRRRARSRAPDGRRSGVGLRAARRGPRSTSSPTPTRSARPDERRRFVGRPLPDRGVRLEDRPEPVPPTRGRRAATRSGTRSRLRRRTQRGVARHPRMERHRRRLLPSRTRTRPRNSRNRIT